MWHFSFRKIVFSGVTSLSTIVLDSLVCSEFHLTTFLSIISRTKLKVSILQYANEIKGRRDPSRSDGNGMEMGDVCDRVARGRRKIDENR